MSLKLLVEKLFKNKIFSYFYGDNFYYIRIFRIVIKIKDTKIYPMLFSERNGFIKGFKIGKWRISFLQIK